MKTITVKSNKDIQKGLKSLSICQKTEDKESISVIEKSFDYYVEATPSLEPKLSIPQVYITKTMDSKEKRESFNFQVKGSFYLTQNRMLFKVNFHHLLDIDIIWKKSFSPKKSEILTK
ncbi:MAG: hypothetical protein HQL27_08530 [Candidatus Omnitrophica bacterium]|nr:hypothetical protein [Candidatus Omnitrophota bacterium]